MRRQGDRQRAQVVLRVIFFHVAERTGDVSTDVREIVTVKVELHFLGQPELQAAPDEQIVVLS